MVALVVHSARGKRKYSNSVALTGAKALHSRATCETCNQSPGCSADRRQAPRSFISVVVVGSGKVC